ncbi:MAG: thioredoxin family protein [Acidobacteria bacterium]|nr:thioredoxin family protein [Acidobacteriota bacterium]
MTEDKFTGNFQTIMKSYLEKSITFAEYLNLIDNLLLEGKTTGENQSEQMFHYGKLNRQRMKRLEKTVKLNDSLKEKLQGVKRKMIWLVITEGWCGDAAQNIPIIEKIAAESLNIETRYLLRDENLELMDKYLTFNARSIPKLICLDAETFEEIGTWGPRPKAAMDYFFEMKAQNLEKPQMMENMQRWYLQDDEQSLQNEFEKLLDEWTSEILTARAI